jgi:uroporphyrin-III C-methyltransferase/precorrin-2 dehydrogenase/sirohydrochlorin ferrochelatase
MHKKEEDFFEPARSQGPIIGRLEVAMRRLPIFLNLTGCDIVLVGVGPAAEAKFRLLRGTGARIHWFTLTGYESESLPAELKDGADDVVLLGGEPSEDDLAAALIVVVAAGPAANERIAMKARAAGTAVNVVDGPELSTFQFPAIIDRGDVVVAAGTGGTSPVLARRLRERIEAMLPERVGELAAFLGRWRKALRAKSSPNAGDRRFWESVIDGPIGKSVLDGNIEEADRLIGTLADTSVSAASGKTGSIALVGAGPGNPDLLTLAALQILQNADAIFYDERVTPAILNRARRDAARFSIGGSERGPAEAVEAFAQQMVEAAKKGQSVVWLVGGNPAGNDRLAEELQKFHDAGIRASIVPGIPSI